MRKIHFQDWPSFFHARKRSSSKRSHLSFILVLERPGLSSLENPSPLFFECLSLSLSIGPLLLSRLDGLLLRGATALDLTSLPDWGAIHMASILGLAFAVTDAVIPVDKSPSECRLKPDKRNKFCCTILIVKSSIYPIWPMSLISWVNWLKEKPFPPSRITTTKE